MRFDAVFFDLDGTLIHTTHLYADACIAGMQSIGLPFSLEDFRRLYPTNSSMAAWITEKGGDPARLQDVRTARDIAYHDLLKTQSTYIQGAPELLKQLRGKTGVVTNSWRSYTDAIHQCIGMYDDIDHLITADEMGDFAKPHPHGLLTLADHVGVDPQKCLFVGDQMFDLEAARAAGMTACLIPGMHTPDEALVHADMVIRSLAELQQSL